MTKPHQHRRLESIETGWFRF